jgi:peroxiredoxin
MVLELGAVAPDFTLRDQHGQSFTLSSYRGEKAVLLVFFPFAFSGVCTGELTGFRDRLGDFETDTTTLLTLSCDPVFTQRAFADRDALFFPLLSDFWPHGEVARAYGVFDERNGGPRRSSYVIDRAGRIAYGLHNDPGEARDLDAQAAALAAIG